MATHVQEGAQLLVTIEHDDQRQPAHVRGEHAARAVELAQVPDVLPGAPEDLLVLGARDLRVGVPAVRQCLRTRLDLLATHGRVILSEVDMRKQLSPDESRGSVGTLARGLDILELFAGDSPELSQTEISERLGLPVPTVHRLVKLLMERGWLVRDRASRRLRLGLGAARLLPAVRLPDIARDPLRAMAERSGETVNLATLDTRSGTGGSEVLYLVSETGSNLLTLRSHVGLRLPVHATALGKCLLAQLDDQDARRVAGSEPYPARTPRTITSWDKLRAQLERIRRDGVAYSREEYEVGLHSIAVPLAWVDGDGPVAVNVSLPSSRAGRDATAELTRELQAAADRITGTA